MLTASEFFSQRKTAMQKKQIKREVNQDGVCLYSFLVFYIHGGYLGPAIPNIGLSNSVPFWSLGKSLLFIVFKYICKNFFKF